MFYTRQALLKAIPCLSHGNTYLKQSHVLHMGIFLLLSQDLHDPANIENLASYTMASHARNGQQPPAIVTTPAGQPYTNTQLLTYGSLVMMVQ